jgi:hypothetical protein
MTIETETSKRVHLLQWARALESGEYKQAIGTLREQVGETDDDKPVFGYCCLGVACNLAAADGVGQWTSEGAGQFDILDGDKGVVDFSETHLPQAVAEWLGVPYVASGNIPLGEDGEMATGHNDEQGASFDDIARMVREEFDLPTREQDAARLAWIEALESGDYAQAKGSLRKIDYPPNAQGVSENGYCCLGVACEVAAKTGGVSGEWEAGSPAPLFIVRDAQGERKDSAGGALPFAVADWLGVPDSDPRIGQYVASTWNDQQGKTFPEIAALLRDEFGYPAKADA